MLLGKDGRSKTPIIAAGVLGKGRVMAWAHGYATADAAAKLSTGRLLANACRWSSGDASITSGGVRVALLQSDLAAFLTTQGLAATNIDGGDRIAQQLTGATTVLCGKVDLTDREIEAITAFVREGGGFVCFSCPWGWAQVRRKPEAEIPLNRILTLAGLALTGGYAEPNKEGVFEAGSVPGPEYHAGRAMDILSDVQKGKREAGDPIVKQAGATATRAVAALPATDTILRPRLLSLLRERSTSLAPTPQRPLKEAQALERVLLALQLSESESARAAEVRAHPAAASFPGDVPATAVAVSRSLVIETGIPRWHSTGLYARPGQAITVTLPAQDADAAGAGLRVRIGCHSDELWHHEQWQRVPRIDASWPIGSARVQVASAFGGLVYIEVPDKSRVGAVTVELAGAVEAPRFILGQTTNQQWMEGVRDLPGPWAELASDRVILTIPSDVARRIDDPAAIMEHWVKVLDADADLAGIPRERACPQRYVADVQISAGYMHSGYPIMTHLDAATFMTDMKGLVDSGWGPYHEMGHNHQDGMWTFEGTGEVTCNLFTLYVLETVCGVQNASRDKVLGDQAVGARLKYLAEGARFQKWKSDPFLALQMYAQLRLAFGWEVYRKVFAEYRALPPAQRPKLDDQKRDQWMVRMSKATGKNLGPFFQAWGVPTSESARDSIKDLPTWMPQEMTDH